MFKGLSHVAIAVPDLEKAIERLSSVYGLSAGEIYDNREQGVRLAYVELDQAEPGSKFQVRIDSGHVSGKKVKMDLNNLVDCKVVSLPFYDPENARQEL